MNGTGGGPVFIGGLDQSGKTPMRRILEASTEVAFSRRTYLWTLVDGRFGDLSDDRALARCFEALRSHATLRELGVDLDEIGRQLRSGERRYARLFDLIGRSVAARAGKHRWGSQEAGVEDRAAALLELFPGARIIHMVRDPRDRYAAIAPRRRRIGALGPSIGIWLANARSAIANVARHPERYRIVRFEDLVLAPGETGRLLAGFIGERDGEAVARAAEAWSAQARRDGSASAGAAATHRLDRRDAHFVESAAGEEMDALGYPRSSHRLSPIEALRYGVVTWPLNRATAATWTGPGSGRAAAARMRKVRIDEALR